MYEIGQTKSVHELTRIIQKPFPDEYPPYSEIYMELIPDDGLVLRHLKENLTKVKELV